MGKRAAEVNDEDDYNESMKEVHKEVMKGMIEEIKKDIMRYAARAREYLDLVAECERQVWELEAAIDKL